MQELRSRILRLPSPEAISDLPREDLESLKKKVVNLIFDLDASSNIRSKDRAIRETIKKGIPPFREPLLAKHVNWYKLSQISQDDLFEKIQDYRCLLLEEYWDKKRKPGSMMSWDVIPFARLKKIWQNYSRQGVVRDASGMNLIIEKMLNNLAKLQAATDLSGHSEMAPEKIAEECEIKAPDDKDDDFYWDFLETPYGTPVSDYGLDPLWKLALQLIQVASPEEQLLLVDRMLNVVHQRGDLAGLFIEGGSQSLSQLSQINPDVEEQKEF